MNDRRESHKTTEQSGYAPQQLLEADRHIAASAVGWLGRTTEPTHYAIKHGVYVHDAEEFWRFLDAEGLDRGLFFMHPCWCDQPKRIERWVDRLPTRLRDWLEDRR